MTNKFPITANICYIINNEKQVLLQYKARGFGEGKWNGPGGKTDDNESDVDSVKREIFEETNLIIKDPELRATLEYVYEDYQEWNMMVHVFTARKYHGEMEGSDEGKLQWFNVSELPFGEMWDDDQYWLARVLLGEKLRMRFFFNKETKKVIKFEYLGVL